MSLPASLSALRQRNNSGYNCGIQAQHLVERRMQPIPETDAWRRLTAYRDEHASISIADLFATEPSRGTNFIATADGLHFDYSRQRASQQIRDALIDLAVAADVPGFLARMCAGDIVNTTERRAALHTACRGTPCDDPAVSSMVAAADQRLQRFVEDVHQGRFTGPAGVPFQAVITIGIGGSELGPSLVVDALRDSCAPRMDVRFCANVDGIAFARATEGLSPATTLVVVVSKSFSTLETTANSNAAKAWMHAELGDAWADNFCIVSANLDATAAFGVPDDRVFPMWDWVGGRFSVWSTVGLPIALAYGWQVFQDFRAGGREIDKHALSASADQNIPIIMALLTVWNTCFLRYQAEACVPYDTRLRLFVPHLQQLQMESNGKSVGSGGALIDVPTQPVVFGGIGSNVQHAFFQQLHQGTVSAPVDILVPATPPTSDDGMHRLLVVNAVAQADALAWGDATAAEPFKQYPGSRSSSMLIYHDLSPATLGKLIAVYEHKTTAAGAIWGINSFDQWGVELGKKLGTEYARMLETGSNMDTTFARSWAAFQRLKGSS